jgi:hypothetical protein
MKNGTVSSNYRFAGLSGDEAKGPLASENQVEPVRMTVCLSGPIVFWIPCAIQLSTLGAKAHALSGALQTRAIVEGARVQAAST